MKKFETYLNSAKMNSKGLLLILLFAILFSCEDVVNVDLNPEDIELISVDAYVNTKSTDNVLVRINKTLPVNTSQENPPVNNAIVEISDDESPANKVTLIELEKKGIYILPFLSNYKIVPGRNYKLSITTEDGIIIQSEEYLQKVEPLDSIQIQLSARGTYQFLGIFINTQETPGLGHYYKWDMYKNGRLQYEPDELVFTSDDFIEGSYLKNFEIFTDFKDPNDETSGIFQFGDTVYVEQHSIQKNTYDFYFLLVNQAFTGSPFSVPPANLSSNFVSSDGRRVLGQFVVSDVSISNTIVIDSTNYTRLQMGY